MSFVCYNNYICVHFKLIKPNDMNNKKIKEKRTATKHKNYTRPEIFRILKAYKDNNYQAKVTADMFNVSVYSINKWRKDYPEVFEAQASPDVLQRVVNQQTVFQAKTLALNTEKKAVALLALQEIKTRLEDVEIVKKIAIKELIEVVKLAEKDNEIDPDDEKESYQRILRNYDDFKRRQKEQAEEAEIIEG